MDPFVIALAFITGLFLRILGFPPMLGYLLAGFIASAIGIGSGESLAPLADAGIALLLFTIGLKLDLNALKPRYVWGSALLHVVIAVPLTTAVILVVGMLYSPLKIEQVSAAWALAFALSFSSTVMAIKVCEARGEAASFHASIAIGILVVQDIMAVVFLSASNGYYPSVWAFSLLLLLFCRPLIRWLFRRIGHGELLLFSGIVFALVTAEVFELLHIKGGLGALLMGILFAYSDRRKAKELYDKLIGIKNLLLIGFFLQIGYYGFPSLTMVVVAVVLTALVVLRPLIYFSLMTLFGLRARTAWLSGLLLFHYSEFGLIVAAVSVEMGLLSPEWVTTLALAMSLSFFLSTPFNNKAQLYYRQHRKVLTSFEKVTRLPEEMLETLGGANTAILGMGRVGTNAYDALRDAPGMSVVGIEERYARAVALKDKGLHCVHGDATDRDFWERTGLEHCEFILVGLSNHQESLRIVELAKELNFKGKLAVATRFADHKTQLEAKGCVAFNLYDEAGKDFAFHALVEFRKKQHNEQLPASD